MSPLPQAILFDMDDTLLLFHSVSHNAWLDSCSDFLQQHPLGMQPQELLRILNEHAHAFWCDPERHRQGRLQLAATTRRLTAQALASIGFTDQDAAARLADDYRERQFQAIRPFPSTIGTLSQLQQLGVRLGLITNGSREEQRRKIDRFNLERFFTLILIEGENDFGKPDPRIFSLALQRLSLPANAVWMVGDDLQWDVAAPQSVGIYSIWHDYENQGLPASSPVQPDRIIHSLSELLDPLPSI